MSASMQRNKLLALHKQQLIKLCKQKNIDINGCLAKMDYVGKLLQHEKKKTAKRMHRESKPPPSKSSGKSQSSKQKKKKSSTKTKRSKENSKSNNNNNSSKITVSSPKSSNKNSNNKAKSSKKTTTTNSKSPSSTSSPSPKSQDQDNENEEVKPPEPADTPTKYRVPIRWSDEEDSSDSSVSIELNVPEYIPARHSLTEVFDINILLNSYNESQTMPGPKFGFSPLPDHLQDKNAHDHHLDVAAKRLSSSSAVSNISALSSFDSLDEHPMPKLKPSGGSLRTIKEEPGKRKLEKDLFKRIDVALGQYYRYFDRKDYFDEEGKGKFWRYCVEKELMDEEKLVEQFDGDNDEPEKCPYLGFDEHFPLILISLSEANLHRHSVVSQQEEDEKEKEKEKRVSVSGSDKEESKEPEMEVIMEYVQSPAVDAKDEKEAVDENANNDDDDDQEEEENAKKEEKRTTDATMRIIEIYNVVEYCFHHGQSPYF